MFTGDPRLLDSDRKAVRIEKCGPNDIYVINENDPYAPDPNKYRHGVLSFGEGPVSFGLDSEKIRDGIQNVIVHNLTDSRYFQYERNVKDKRHIQFRAW